MTSTTSQSLDRAEGFGSVDDVPELPTGFRDVFHSYLVEANGVRHHVVVGGDGPPLLLLGGWPQTWYTWRELMLPLAERFTVIAPDPRGVGLSEVPTSGYDSTSLAKDMLDLMTVLGHERFAMVGHDIGAATAYAMAADAPDRLSRVAIGETIIAGVSPSPELIPDNRWLSDFLWHFNFNRARGVNERLVRGREEIYIGHQFESKAGHPDAVPEYARSFYIEMMKRNPDQLRASFEYYRDLDECIPQNRARMVTPITIPVLSYAGALACGRSVEEELHRVATNVVDSIIIDDCGHYVSEEKPNVLLEALQRFLDPYSDRVGVETD